MDKIHQALLAHANHELERARKWEAEANQMMTEQLLLRGECIRLRNVLEQLSDHLCRLYEQSGAVMPDDVHELTEAFFPPDPEAEQ
ncbi:MAG: hypothetical protein IT489_03175 [Gammaproteobacteria bacterium]|nr:hypothetical protein [Gammaproteobacteria bacterium]